MLGGTQKSKDIAGTSTRKASSLKWADLNEESSLSDIAGVFGSLDSIKLRSDADIWRFKRTTNLLTNPNLTFSKKNEGKPEDVLAENFEKFTNHFATLDPPSLADHLVADLALLLHLKSTPWFALRPIAHGLARFPKERDGKPYLDYIDGAALHFKAWADVGVYLDNDEIFSASFAAQSRVSGSQTTNLLASLNPSIRERRQLGQSALVENFFALHCHVPTDISEEHIIALTPLFEKRLQVGETFSLDRLTKLISGLRLHGKTDSARKVFPLVARGIRALKNIHRDQAIKMMEKIAEIDPSDELFGVVSELITPAMRDHNSLTPNSMRIIVDVISNYSKSPLSLSTLRKLRNPSETFRYSHPPISIVSDSAKSVTALNDGTLLGILKRPIEGNVDPAYFPALKGICLNLLLERETHIRIKNNHNHETIDNEMLRLVNSSTQLSNGNLDVALYPPKLSQDFAKLFLLNHTNSKATIIATHSHDSSQLAFRQPTINHAAENTGWMISQQDESGFTLTRARSTVLDTRTRELLARRQASLEKTLNPKAAENLNRLKMEEEAFQETIINIARIGGSKKVKPWYPDLVDVPQDLWSLWARERNMPPTPREPSPVPPTAGPSQ